jgi:LytR cell envelope-related transcriptional attenuator
MSDDGRLPPAWGTPGGPRGPEHGLAGLFDPPVLAAEPPHRPEHGPQHGPPPQPPSPWGPVPTPPDPALLAAQHQAQLEASAAALASADDSPRSGGAHRARRQPARYILPAVGAAIAVLLIGVGISGWLGAKQPDSSTSPLVSHHTLVSTPPPSPAPTPTASASKAPTPPPSHTAKPPAVVAAPPVVHAPTVVLNETVIRGLAAQVAAVLRTKHWMVTGVGNWFGQIPSTTVYYPPGMEAAARSLAYDLRISRLRPSVRGMLTNRLTVVLTDNPF